MLGNNEKVSDSFNILTRGKGLAWHFQQKKVKYVLEHILALSKKPIYILGHSLVPKVLTMQTVYINSS